MLQPLFSFSYSSSQVSSPCRFFLHISGFELSKPSLHAAPAVPLLPLVFTGDLPRPHTSSGRLSTGGTAGRECLSSSPRVWSPRPASAIITQCFLTLPATWVAGAGRGGGEERLKQMVVLGVLGRQ